VNEPAVLMLLASVLCVAVSWLSPPAIRDMAVATITIGTLALLSPQSALWLGVSTVLTPPLMALGDRRGWRGIVVLTWGGLLVLVLLATRIWQLPYWIGGAYFTLRHLHVLLDWWMGRLERPSLRRYVRYQFFLPVIAAGPINRIQHFEHQIQRRRWDQSEFFAGAERALLGAAQVVLLGGVLMNRAQASISWRTSGIPDFLHDWLMSALGWIQLYLSFAGLTSVALGLSLMLGLRLEENFDRPWRARTLVDFWTRWHMTLSYWCRDYVFQPIVAMSRNPLLALSLAMLVLALWHALSAYYLLWAVWQTAGIALTHLATRLGLRFPPRTQWLLGPIAVLGWVSLAHPVITSILGGKLL
jgi:D-alanyl-lipoteichoic acid acyltransferase DltB (MBOAT superfamily)